MIGAPQHSRTTKTSPLQWAFYGLCAILTVGTILDPSCPKGHAVLLGIALGACVATALRDGWWRKQLAPVDRRKNGDVGPNGCRECLLAYTAGLGMERKNCVGMHCATARAVIQAMREPTAAMVQTACPSHTPGVEMSAGRGERPHHRNAAFRWRTMIDEALK